MEPSELFNIHHRMEDPRCRPKEFQLSRKDKEFPPDLVLTIETTVNLESKMLLAKALDGLDLDSKDFIQPGQTART